MKTLLSSLWALLKPILVKIGHIQARVILAVLYGVLMVPLGFLMGYLSDLVGIKKRRGTSFWVDKHTDTDIDQFSRRQY